MRYMKRRADEKNFHEVTKEDALWVLLSTYRDNAITRHMLEVPGKIPCLFSDILVEENC